MKRLRGGWKVGRNRFDHRLTSTLPGIRDVLRILRTGGFKPKDAAAAAIEVPIRPAPLPNLQGAQASLTWVGHATFVVRMGGATILCDPVWSRTLPGFVRRLTPPGLDWADLPRVDAVVVSHNHFDHLDAPTVKRLPRDTRILVGLGGGHWFRRRGFLDVVELDWWESAPVGAVRCTFVPAHHWSRRGILDRNKSLWGGWVMESGRRSAYFAGDTGYGPAFSEIGSRHPGIEAAMLPVGAYDPEWFMRPVHIDPDEALQAFQDVGARHLVPMHWGTFPLTREPVMQPLQRIRAAWAADGRPAADLWDLAIGETRTWGQE